MDWFGFATLIGLAILALMTALSHVHLPAGLMRVCEFPRVQIAILAAVFGVAGYFTFAPDTLAARMGVVALAGFVVVVQAWHIAPYTKLWREESRRAETYKSDAVLKVLVCNVLQTNSNYQAVVDLIGKQSPDILVLMEVDDAWIDGLKPATSAYPHKLEISLDNLYGMALYSKLELIDPQGMYILRDDIPSIVTTCRLRNGRLIRFIAVHPEPPLPHTGTLERDAEIIIAGQMALAVDLPAIVTGDLNDVAWSRTTRRFRRLSGLLDPRVGRGFYNTFNANWPLFRWPLDHLFHDRHFSLVEMACLDNVGSDHFPIYFEVLLNSKQAAGEDSPAPRKADLDEARALLDGTDHPVEDTLAPAKPNVIDG